MALAITDINAQCTDYARYHSVMILMMVIFFGSLIVPHCMEKIKIAGYHETSAKVEDVYSTDPKISYIGLSYVKNGKKMFWHESVRQQLTKGDHVQIFISDNGEKVVFESPSRLYYTMILFLYVIIFVLCLGLFWQFFFRA